MNKEQSISAERIAELWTTVSPSIAAYVSAEIRDRHDAEDVFQQIGAEVTSGAGKYDSSRPFLNWVFGIARIQVIRHFHNRAKEHTVFSSELTERLADAYDAVLPEISARQDALRQCLKRLNPKQQKAIQLYYRDEISQLEIAELMGMSKSAVGVLIHRTRLALRECIRHRLKREEG